MKKWIARFGILLTVVALIAIEAAAPQPALSAGRTIIVLDASGSMWGKVQGGIKIEVAKKAVSDLVSSIDPATELGLMAYGHRRKGDCKDIELLVPPSPDRRAAILKAVAALAPKGKTPLCDAVLMAADAIKFQESKATVILVSDGIETCGKDPCAVGDALAARGIDFICHVIGFGLKDEEKRGLKCLAENTGGMYLDAKDASTLRHSLNKAIETVIQPETHLVLAARNAKGDLLSGVTFKIFRPEDSEKPLHTGMGGKFRQKLEPGKYTVTAKFGQARAKASVEVPKGVTTQYELKFQATALRAKALLTKGGKPIEKDLSWRVYAKPPGSKSRPEIAYSYEAQPTFYLSPGTYYVAVFSGSATAEKQVKVVANKATEAVVVLGSGFIIATATMTEDSEPLTKDLTWYLYSAPDREGDRRQVAWSYDVKPRFVVPAGKYLLQVQHGASIGRREVTVTAGETTNVAVKLDAGTVLLKPPASSTKSTWYVYRITPDGKRISIAYSYDSEFRVTLPAGKFLAVLEDSSGKENKVYKKEFEVVAGKFAEVTVGP